MAEITITVDDIVIIFMLISAKQTIYLPYQVVLSLGVCVCVCVCVFVCVCVYYFFLNRISSVTNLLWHCKGQYLQQFITVKPWSSNLIGWKLEVGVVS